MTNDWKQNLAVIAVCGVLFVLLGYTVSSGLTDNYDRHLLAYLASHATAQYTGLFRIITWGGSLVVLAPLALLVSYLCLVRKRRSEALLLLNSLACAAVISRGLKYVISRERPDIYPPLAETFFNLAFPSTHAAQVTAFCLALFMLTREWQLSWRTLLGLILLGAVVSVVISRLYLQVHYPSDVLAGVLLGAASVSAARMLRLFP